MDQIAGSMRETNIAELICSARQGDAAAFDELFSHMRLLMRGRATSRMDRRLLARVDGSDVMQDSLLEAYRDLQSFRGSSENEFIAWFVRILSHNADQAHQRHVQAAKRSVINERSLDESRAGRPPAREAVAKHEPSPSSQFRRKEELSHVSDLLDALPPHYREVIRLHHLEGWSLKQIAQQCGRTEQSVAGLLKRGCRKLREHART